MNIYQITDLIRTKESALGFLHQRKLIALAQSLSFQETIHDGALVYYIVGHPDVGVGNAKQYHPLYSPRFSFIG
jgi:hypothetical protein